VSCIYCIREVACSKDKLSERKKKGKFKARAIKMIKFNQKWAYKSAKVQCKSHVKLKLTGKWKMTLLLQ